ncbi:DHH family phosphoesterase [Aureibacillus halotolerans]|uniref:Cyclic-di-AMP phosphodiesterase n=1 Tax=Aureibacillus halotolerans TaxID=1508390 RepID=A0A4R6TWV8_9BACI|nr:DHH family phosphoesterase [Aureibacillus halotolerans]TDQ38360.1 c-di-AMP phosphodiesterase-like protein [Aureibacillus halotolerans]
MPNFDARKKYPPQMLVLLALGLIAGLLLVWHEPVTGIVCLLLWAGAAVFAFIAENRQQKQLTTYVSNLSHRVKKVGGEVLQELPLGILLFNERYEIDWANQHLASFLKKESLPGLSLNDISPALIPLLKEEASIETVTLHGRTFRIYFKSDERLLYFFDITEQHELEKQFKDEQIAFGLIYLDNYEEVTQGMDDQLKSNINSQVTSAMNQWAIDHGIYLKKVAADRFFAVLNRRILRTLEKEKFTILDDIRHLTSKQNIPLTLSIAVGSGEAPYPELGFLAQSSLDLALGRGGDQVAIKQTNGKVRFYGGKTNPIEKRTRVRARVISHALRELVLSSDQVFIMGHRYPDMDAVGASLGVLKIAQANDKKGRIVLNPNELDTGVRRLMAEVKENDRLWQHFITPEQAMEAVTRNTLLVIVDTNKPSMVIDERLISKTDHVVVIDHHRRGEDFINDAVLVYMEPYASSTAELVTELLEYQPKGLEVSMLEATALLAGIIVDTKSFTLRTGARTFDAASYLRSKGADTVLVQKFLKEDIDHFVQRAQLISNADIYRDGIAIARGDMEEGVDQVLIAQAADTLLAMNEVTASFVICRREDGKISVSARSLGDINVQLIMESLGGGGHLSNAAAQFEGGTVDEAIARLRKVIDEYLEGGDEE